MATVKTKKGTAPCGRFRYEFNRAPFSFDNHTVKKLTRIIALSFLGVAVILLLLYVFASPLATDKYTNEKNETAFADGEVGAAQDALAGWQSYIADDVLYKDVIVPASHNAGTLKTRLFGLIPLEKLNCQEDDIFTQLVYGIRSFDLRFGENPISKIKGADSIVYVCHGGISVAKYSLKNVLEDVIAFNQLYPDEIIILGFDTGNVKSAEAKKEVSALFTEYLTPSLVFLASDPNPNTATMKELRESGKRLIISSSFYAEAVPFTQYLGTWSGEYNFSDYIDTAGARRLYDHYSFLLLNEAAADAPPISFSTNRARSGEAVPWRTPYDFMLNDRSELTLFYDFLERNPDVLMNVREFSGDFMTHDYFQTGRCVLLNAAKGNIDGEKQQEFVEKLNLLLMQ
ncbi:MAG: hypothetical protein LBN25_02120 [Christensenellaceae bacterium]|jgi:hypothetical protein|nr:hypothetical protein [Christensenellaceae bacterium]